MLDTNVVSHLMRGHSAVDRAGVGLPRSALWISAVTTGELLFGPRRRLAGHWADTAIERFLAQAETIPWDARAARTHGDFRADLERRGQTLSPLDLLIAAHALALGAVLVTSDQAMLRLPDLETEEWTRDV